MLNNRKRTYMLATFTVERRSPGWFFRKTYIDDAWRGPYSSEASVCLTIAHELRRELIKRDRAAA